ncbi:MAG: hypothetical protein IT223_09735 [Crocinitomicaceae bacterium]|nr:hypothetical protein [Crocinitomicaceae bacterium]
MLRLFFCVLMMSSCHHKTGKIVSFDFENSDINTIASDWSAHFYGEGATNWNVISDNGNNVFAQLQNINPDNHFNIAVYDKLEVTDMELSVKMCATKGIFDQGGGIVWRYKNESNHYILRANPLENDLVLFKMENGERIDLPLVNIGRTYGVEVDYTGADWHTIGVKVEGNLFTAFFDGREMFKVQDSSFTDPGKIGLWTKSDACTYFDDLKIIPIN